MKLTARNQEQQNALAHAFHDRERFTLTGAGLQAEFVADTLNRVPCVFGSGRYETNLELVQVTEATTYAAWTGERLPPVGTVCEVLNNELSGPEWERCTILYSGKFRVMYDSESCYERVGFIDNLKFRPIRTPDQIAEEDRLNAIECMSDLVGDIDQIPTWTDALAKLYDAGYRKV